MAYPWLRLYSDMPNDPKFRTISKVCGHPITWVLSVYIHLLVIASNASERGRTENLSDEDIASALDLEAQHVTEIIAAMQGRVLDGDRVSGWDKRQPKREDNSAERGRAYRAAKKNEAEQMRTQANAAEQKKPLDKTRRDKKREGESVPVGTPAPAGALTPFTEEHRKFIVDERPDLVNPERVFANFCDRKTPRQRTMANWRIWVRNEHASSDKQPPSVTDPDSRAAVEAEAKAKGLPAWDQMEQWPQYLAKVRKTPARAAA